MAMNQLVWKLETALPPSQASHFWPFQNWISQLATTASFLQSLHHSQPSSATPPQPAFFSHSTSASLLQLLLLLSQPSPATPPQDSQASPSYSGHFTQTPEELSSTQIIYSPLGLTSHWQINHRESRE